MKQFPPLTPEVVEEQLRYEDRLRHVRVIDPARLDRTVRGNVRRALGEQWPLVPIIAFLIGLLVML